MPISKFIECCCSEELLRIDCLPEDRMVELSMYKRGTSSTIAVPSWKYRLRMIWRIIRYGDPYGDYMILNEVQLVDAIQALTEAQLAIDKPNGSQ